MHARAHTHTHTHTHQALMKYYNDPGFLAKLGQKLGSVAPAAAGAGPAAAAPQQAPPEITDLLEAAR